MKNACFASRIVLASSCCLAILSAPDIQAQRLPATVIPEHYSLALTPDLKAAKYSGVETIDVTIGQPTAAITLNATEIIFDSVHIHAAGGDQTATVTLDGDKQQATLTVPHPLAAGKASIEIHFTGTLNNELRGFYLSKTARRNYAVTQFEAIDARHAFPCFDEPALKATFDVSLVIDAADTAISNTPIASDTPGPVDGKHTLKFEPTPKMSTYLLAFLVGDFQCTSGKQDNVAIRVCSTPDKVALTSYGVEVASFVLHYYNNYFGIPYPLKQLDLIALPDFEAGAMENFGAITYREDALLADTKTASLASLKGVAEVIAHEMAHQWFGDLVTMQWWDNIWLNEGFATWMEKKPVAAMHPEWNIDESVIAELDGTLNLDAATTTRTIRAKADSPDEINQMFEGITYGKASDVLLTLENYLGEETFRQGVHNYLAAHLYGNATAEDFWNAQTSTSHKPVDKIMESLVTQPGEPLISFGEPSSGSVSVSQRRFFLSPSANAGSDQRWTLPVCFKAGGDAQSCQLLTPDSNSLRAPATGLFFPNARGKGYYRTAYPLSVYKALLPQAETALTAQERIALIGDEWAQVRANTASVADVLDLAASLKSDSSAEVIGEFAGEFDAIYRRVAATQTEKDQFAAWIRANFAPQLARLGDPSPSDSPNTRLLRSNLFGLLGGIGKDPAVRSRAREITEKYLADPSSVDSTLGLTAAYVAAQSGDVALFEKLQKVYETSTDPQLQANALYMLANVENPVLAHRALDYAVSGKVRNQDAVFAVINALSVDSNQEMVWNYIKTHWDRVQAQFTTALGGYLVGSTGAFCSADARNDVQKFFSEHKVPSSSVSLIHAVDQMNACMEFRKLQQPNLKSWLSSEQKNTAM